MKKFTLALSFLFISTAAFAAKCEKEAIKYANAVAQIHWVGEVVEVGGIEYKGKARGDRGEYKKFIVFGTTLDNKDEWPYNLVYQVNLSTDCRFMDVKFLEGHMQGKIMKKVFILLSFIFAVGISHAGNGIVMASQVLGKYVDANGKVQAQVKKSRKSDSHFEKVNVDVGHGLVTLAYDGHNEVFRGFYSYHCDDPTCLYIGLHEITLFAKKGKVQLKWELHGFQWDDEMEEEPWGAEVHMSGLLFKK